MTTSFPNLRLNTMSVVSSLYSKFVAEPILESSSSVTSPKVGHWGQMESDFDSGKSF